jgi:hypothetical protein
LIDRPLSISLYEGQPGQMTPMKRELSTENEPRANAESTVEGDD